MRVKKSIISELSKQSMQDIKQNMAQHFISFLHKLSGDEGENVF